MKPPKTEQQIKFEKWFRKSYPSPTTPSLERRPTGDYAYVPACYMWRAIVAANNNFKLKEDDHE